jgi:hypothetical protein
MSNAFIVAGEVTGTNLVLLNFAGTGCAAGALLRVCADI